MQGKRLATVIADDFVSCGFSCFSIASLQGSC